MEAVGAAFLVFATLETGLKIDGFLVVERIQSRAGVEGKSLGILSL